HGSPPAINRMPVMSATASRARRKNSQRTTQHNAQFSHRGLAESASMIRVKRSRSRQQLVRPSIAPRPTRLLAPVMVARLDRRVKRKLPSPCCLASCAVSSHAWLSPLLFAVAAPIGRTRLPLHASTGQAYLDLRRRGSMHCTLLRLLILGLCGVFLL